MSDLRKAAEMALEALELGDDISAEQMSDALDALRQALAQQERVNEITRQFVGVNEDGSERWVETEYRTVIRSEWVELTEDEYLDILNSSDGVYEYLTKLEAKLKEKNT